MNTTVTMSLERYKELEAKEIALNEILGGTQMPIVVENIPYGTMVYCSNPNSINEMLIEEAKRQTEWGEEMRLKAVESRTKCTK